MTPRHLPSRARPSVERPMGVVDQVVLACSPRNRLATVLGFVLGGVVPIATYGEAHLDLDWAQPLHCQTATYLVLGGLAFSAKTVFSWSLRAFRDGWKAGGFVVLLEGVMVTSHVPFLPLVLLAILVAVNGIATGCALSLDRSRQRSTSTTVIDRALRPAVRSVAATLALAEASPRDLHRGSESLPAPATRASSRPQSTAPAPQGRFTFAEGSDVN